MRAIHRSAPLTQSLASSPSKFNLTRAWWAWVAVTLLGPFLILLLSFDQLMAHFMFSLGALLLLVMQIGTSTRLAYALVRPNRLSKGNLAFLALGLVVCSWIVWVGCYFISCVACRFL